MRVLFILSAVLALQTVAMGQTKDCPTGNCPLQSRGQLVDLGPVPPVGMKPPSDKHEWKYFPDLKVHGWDFKDEAKGAKVTAAPAPKAKSKVDEPPAPPVAAPFGLNLPAPKFNDSTASDYKPLHGKIFYRVVRDNVYHKLVHEKGMKPDEARKLVESMSAESIDTYGKAVGINAVGGIGDGKILDWIVAHKDQIIALIKLIVSLLAFVDNATDGPVFVMFEVEWNLAV